MPDQAQKKIFSAERQNDGVTHSFDGSGISNAEILHAIAGLRAELEGVKGNGVALAHNGAGNGAAADAEPAEETEAVRVEIARMVRMLSHVKGEIAAIKHPLSAEDRMHTASGQLDAIVEATESATQDILGASEKIEDGINKLGALHALDEETAEIIGDIAQHVVSILEACNFQDITGQRISKVVKTIRFIEERVISMIDIWGREQFTGIPIPQNTVADDADDAALLNGPQLDGEGLQQSEIDALFD